MDPRASPRVSADSQVSALRHRDEKKAHRPSTQAAIAGSGVSGGTLGYADAFMSDQMIAARGDASNVQISGFDTASWEGEVKKFSEGMFTINPQQEVLANVRAAVAHTQEQLKQGQALENSWVKAQVKQIGKIGQTTDHSQLRMQLQVVDDVATKKEESQARDKQTVQMAVNDGKLIAEASVEALTSGQNKAMELQGSQMTAWANGIAQASNTATDAQFYRFKKQTDAIGYAIRERAETASKMAAHHAAGVESEAGAREKTRLGELRVEKQQVEDKHEEAMLNSKVEEQQQKVADGKEQMAQARAHKAASDQQQLAAELKKSDAEIAAEEQKLAMERQKAELELQMKQQQDEYTRVQKEFEQAMKAYSAELADATERCWSARAAGGMEVTKKAPRIDKRADGTQYVTEWHVSYRPKH